MVAGIMRGDEVIIPSHTYVATADAIHLIGATPVLVDCDDDHLISLQGIEDAITSKTTAIIAVNLNGRAASLTKISELATRYNLKLVEDNAQGLGAKIDGRFAGNFGELSSLSFYPAKTFGCLGDGGAIITNSEEYDQKLRAMRNHGRNPHGQVQMWGVNSRLDNLQAAVLLSRLPYLDSYFERRREIASIYSRRFIGIDDLVIPSSPGSEENRYDTFQNYEVRVKNREKFRLHLSEHGVGTLLPWSGKAIHQLNLPGVRSSAVVKTESFFKEILMLPMNHYMSDQDVKYVSDVVTDYFLAN
jgi:dTDP-4-amino-4,6-dideoxygalactose transaminase